MIRRPPKSPLFPYTPLSRSHRHDPLPGIDGVIRDLACNNNARIVEDVVNAPELLHRLVHNFTDSSKVTHIEMPGGSAAALLDRKSTRLNSSHLVISYAVFCL